MLSLSSTWLTGPFVQNFSYLFSSQFCTAAWDYSTPRAKCCIYLFWTPWLSANCKPMTQGLPKLKQLNPPILLRVHSPIVWEYRKTIINIKTRIHHRLTMMYTYFKVIATSICGQEELILNKAVSSLNWDKYQYFNVAFQIDTYQHNIVVRMSTLQVITSHRANSLTHLDKRKHP